MNAASRIKYADLVDLEKLQILLESFHRVIGIANAVIDTQGVVLAQAGWQRACRDFHRTNTETCKRCIESDTALVARMTQGEHYAAYHCLNGLVDTAAPIVVDGQHVANVFTGQFLPEAPDLAAFRERARAAGFDEEAYLAAIAELPVVPAERVQAITSLYAQLAAMLADHGLDRLRQKQSAEKLQQLNAELEARIQARTAELEKSELHMRSIVQASPVPKAIFAPDGSTICVNPAFTRSFGYMLEDVPSLARWWEQALPDPAVREARLRTWQAHLQDSQLRPGQCEPVRLSIAGKDGEVRVVMGEASVVGTDGEDAMRMLVFHDITDLIKATEAQARSEARLRALYETSNDAIMLLDRDSFLECNKATLSMFGVATKEAFCTLGPAGVSPPNQPDGGDSSALAQQYIEEAFCKGISHFEWTHKRSDNGKAFVVDVKLSRFELDDKPILLAIVRDITEKKLAEWAMATQKTLLQTVLDKSPSGVAISVDETLRFVNRTCVETFGVRPGDAAPNRFVDPAVRDALLARMAREGIVEDCEVEMFDSQRRQRAMRATYMPITYEGESGVLSWIEDVTEKKAAEKLIAQQQEAMQKLLDSSPVGMAFTTDGVFSFANAAFRQMFDIVPGDKAETIYLRPEDRQQLMDLLGREGTISGREMRLRGAGGATRDMLMTYIPFVHAGAEGLMGWAIDITERKQAERALLESKERLEAAASAGIVGVWDWDVRTNKLVWDKVMYRLYGIREEDFSGALEAWTAAVHPEDMPRLEREIQAALRGERDYNAEFRVVMPDQSLRYLKAVSHTSFDAQGMPVRMIGVNYDLTEQKAIQQQLDQMAYYDRLTRLPNRRLLEDRLEQAIGWAQREWRRMALLFIDLDRFKEVNDVHGHEAGDWLLKEVAARLLSCLRTTDTAARIGGDEFIILLPDADETAAALQVAERIRQAMERPFQLGADVQLDISSSIGVTIYPDHAENARDLMKFGDEAMYKAKKGGRNAVVLFDSPEVGTKLMGNKGEALLRLQWKDALASGNPKLDEEHRELLREANALIDLATRPDTRREQFNAAFDTLLDFVCKHFADEEVLLRAHDYADLAQHAAMHRSLVARAVQLRKESDTGSLSVGALVDFLLTEVVCQHIIKEDKKFFALVGAGARTA